MYAAGNITTLGGKDVSRIAKWNGTNWSNVGSGIDGGFGYINCMAVYKNELYVGGDFTYAGGNIAYNIARWNGSRWDSLGSGLDGTPKSMVVDTINNVLYVGGTFFYAGGIYTKNIARWDGNTWSKVGVPITNGAVDMAMYHNELFVGMADLSPNISRWNGKEWKWVYGLNSSVISFKVHNDFLYVGGYFTKANGVWVNSIVRFYSPPDTTIVSDEILKKNEFQNFFEIMPNPPGNDAMIIFSDPTNIQGSMKIYDLQGIEIKQWQITSGTKRKKISLEDFRSGVYLCEILFNGEKRIFKKMIVIK